MAEHTPGPWKYTLTRWAGSESVQGFVIDADGKDVHLCGVATNMGDKVTVLDPEWAKRAGLEGKHFTSEEVEANARLIAAAPDLLEAATHALLIMCAGLPSLKSEKLLEAAIKKARGKK